MKGPTLKDHQAQQRFNTFRAKPQECPVCHCESITVKKRYPFGKGADKGITSCTTCHTELVQDWLESRR